MLGQEVILWQSQLDSEEKCQDSTDEEEEESKQEVKDTDFFVIRCGQPRLEVSPEVSDGECLGVTSIEDPHGPEKDD